MLLLESTTASNSGRSHLLTRVDSAKSLLLWPHRSCMQVQPLWLTTTTEKMPCRDVGGSTLVSGETIMQTFEKESNFSLLICVTTERNLKSPRTFALIRHNQAVEIMENRNVSSRIYFPFRLAKSTSENPQGKWVSTGRVSWVCVFLCTVECFTSYDSNEEKNSLLLECKD